MCPASRTSSSTRQAAWLLSGSNGWSAARAGDAAAKAAKTLVQRGSLVTIFTPDCKLPIVFRDRSCLTMVVANLNVRCLGRGVALKCVDLRRSSATRMYSLVALGTAEAICGLRGIGALDCRAPRFEAVVRRLACRETERAPGARLEAKGLGSEHRQSGVPGKCPFFRDEAWLLLNFVSWALALMCILAGPCYTPIAWLACGSRRRAQCDSEREQAEP